jgi:enoyl-CoA hydratase
MAQEHIHVEEHGDVALVRVDRPPANAMDLELLAEGAAVLAELESAAPGAAVLTGREGFFSAGVDLKVAPTLAPDEQRDMVAGINRLFAGWYAFSRPLVCAVNGHAIAGGLILALCGDYRVCATEGKLGLTELRAGIPYPAAAIGVVRVEMSPQAARQLVLGADLVVPQRALELGVVDEIATPGQVVPRALEVAAAYAALPRDAYTRVKRQLRGSAIEAIERAVADDPMSEGWLSGESAGAAAGILGGN